MTVTDVVQPATDNADQTTYIAVGVGVTLCITAGSPERDTELSAVKYV